MYLRTVATFSFLLTLVAAHWAAVPDNVQISHPHKKRSAGVVSVRHPLAQSSTSSTHTHTTSTSRTTATSSPINAPEHRNHNVAVGFNGTTFTPTALKNITIGDTLTFYFYPHNFSIVQSSFSHPCVPMTGITGQPPIFSGFGFDSASGISLNKFVVNLTTTDPIWIYGFDGNAADGGSVCQRGMAMVINPLAKAQANGETLRAYVNGANAVALDVAGATVEKAPDMVYGGKKVALTERQKAHWEAKHPQNVSLSSDSVADNGSGVDVNSTTTFGTAGNNNGTNLTQISSFHNGAERGASNRTTLTGFAVLFVAAVFGFGL